MPICNPGRDSYDDLMAFIRFFAGAKLFSLVKL